MGDRYLDSTNLDSPGQPFETWATAATTLQAILTDGTAPLLAGEKIFVNSAHTENPGINIVYTFPGSNTAPSILITVDMAGDPEPPIPGDYLKASAITINNTGATRTTEIKGFVKFYGLEFDSEGDFTVDTGASQTLFDDCLITISRVDNGGFFVGHTGTLATVHLKNTVLDFNPGGTSEGIEMNQGGRFFMKGGKIGIETTQPLSLFFSDPTKMFEVNLAGVDISEFTGNLVDLGGSGSLVFEAHHCVLNSSVTLTTGTIIDDDSSALFVGCDDTTGNKLYRMEYFTREGKIEEEIVIVVSSGGASDGVTPISWKMSNNAITELFYRPLISPPIVALVDSTGSKTFTVQCNWGSGTPDTDQVWLEVEHLDVAANTDSKLTNNGPTDPLDVGTAITTVTGVSWDGSLTDEDPFSLVVTATVNRVGPVICRVCFAEPSGGAGADVLYVDPKVTVADA